MNTPPLISLYNREKSVQRRAKAEKALKQAVELASDDRSNHLRLAETLVSLGKAKEAILVAEKVIELAPLQSHGYELSAPAYDIAGDLPKAATLYRESPRRMGHDPNRRSRIQLRLKEIEARLAVMSKK